MSEIIELVGLI